MGVQIIAKDVLAKLRDLARDAGNNLFQRLTLAKSLWDSREWVEEIGDKWKASAVLQRYFPDLNDHWEIGNLMVIIGNFPDLKTWEESRFDLWAMWCLSLGKEATARRIQRLKEQQEYKAKRIRENRERLQRITGIQLKKEKALQAGKEWVNEDELMALGLREIQKWMEKYKGCRSLWKVISSLQPTIDQLCQKKDVLWELADSGV